MRRAAVVLGVAAAALLAGAGRAGATNECRGLQVCVPVEGPWVVVPTGRSVPRPQVQFQLSCPKGYVVGGTDAELTHPAIDLWFLGSLGAPVNPGITTSRDLVFVASFVGAGVRAPSFRPHIGCLPGQGGGGRVPTAARVGAPGRPTVRHVVTRPLSPLSIRRIVSSCAPGEHLVGAETALGFYQDQPPRLALVSAVRLTRRVGGNRVLVTARAGGAVATTTPVVQVEAICAGGR